MHIHKAFCDNLTEFFTEWLGDKVEHLGPNEKVLTPTRHVMAQWFKALRALPVVILKGRRVQKAHQRTVTQA